MNTRKNTLWHVGLASVLTLAIVSGCSTTTTSMRTDEEGEWYHSVEIDEWVKAGAERDVIEKALTNIEQSTKPRHHDAYPDTVIDYGPGQWIYEFTMAGDAAMEAAEISDDPIVKGEYYKAAITYYHLASSPHTNDLNQMNALQKSSDAYQAYAALQPWEFEKVNLTYSGKPFDAYYHLPPGEQPFPAVVVSNGSDMSKEMALSYFTQHLLPKGIAMVSIDMPGMGGSRAFDFSDGQSDKLHAAAVQALQQDKRFLTDAIFVDGASFGGHAAARILLARPELDVAGVVSLCGPLHSPFLAPAKSYDELPTFTIDGVKSRVGLATTASTQTFADSIRILSLENQGLAKGPLIETPLLIITTNRDPVAPVSDLTIFDRVVNKETIIFDIEGHCSDRFVRQSISSSWILSQVDKINHSE